MDQKLLPRHHLRDRGASSFLTSPKSAEVLLDPILHDLRPVPNRALVRIDLRAIVSDSCPSSRATV
jgi:hypothetical protein